MNLGSHDKFKAIILYHICILSLFSVVQSRVDYSDVWIVVVWQASPFTGRKGLVHQTTVVLGWPPDYI
jgi:hypothetical protein